MARNSGGEVSGVPEVVDRLGGGLVSIVLGALILWVGQTTFQHAGQLATVEKQFDGLDHRFNTVDHQIQSVESRHNDIRERMDNLVADISNRTRSRFTAEDGDKLENRLHQLTDRITALQLKLMAIESRGIDGNEIAALKAEVAQLRYVLLHSNSNLQAQAGQYASGVTPNVATSTPTYLPPANSRR